MLALVDVLFHVVHLSFIIINLTFWISFRTLRLAQLTLLLTLISWVGFGFVYGFGYCFLTDWHWTVKEHLGETNLPMSYIKYVLDEVTRRNWDPQAVDVGTTAALVIALVGCAIQSYRAWKDPQKLNLPALKSPRPSRPGEINYHLFDIFTFAHFGIGVVYYFLGMTFWWAFVLAWLWEFSENFLKAYVPVVFPNATADTWTNRFGDVIAVSLGWYASSLLR
jgi:hypothetical protein